MKEGIPKTILDLPLELLYAVVEDEDVSENGEDLVATCTDLPRIIHRLHCHPIDKKDLESLRLTHKHFAIALLPVLFKTISLTFEDDPIWNPIEFDDTGPRNDETQLMYTQRMVAKWTARLAVEKKYTPVKDRIATLSKKRQTSTAFRTAPRTFILDVSQPPERVDNYTTYFCKRKNLISDIKTWFPNVTKIILKINLQANVKGHSRLMKRLVTAFFNEEKRENLELALDVINIQASPKQFPKDVRNCSELSFSGYFWTLINLSSVISNSLTASPGVTSIKIADTVVTSEWAMPQCYYFSSRRVDFGSFFKHIEVDALENLRSLSFLVQISSSDATILRKLPALKELSLFTYATKTGSRTSGHNNLSFQSIWDHLRITKVFLTKINVKMMDRTLLAYLRSCGKSLTDLSVIVLRDDSRDRETWELNKTFWLETLPQLSSLRRLTATSRCTNYFYYRGDWNLGLSLQIPGVAENLVGSLSSVKELTVGVHQGEHEPNETINLEELVSHLAESAIGARQITIDLMCHHSVTTTDSQSIARFKRTITEVFRNAVERSRINGDAFADGTAIYIQIFATPWKRSHGVLKFIARGGKLEKAI